MGKRTELRQRMERQRRNTAIAFVAGLALICLAVVTLATLPEAGLENAGNTNSISAVPVDVNYPAPELSLEDMTGQIQSLTDFHGKVTLVNNWAIWCPPCKAEMPTLVAFYNDHAQEGLMIVAIEAGESRDQVQKFVDQYQMPFAVWLDPNGKSLTAFKNGNLPNSFVIDRTGTIRLTWTGEINRATLEKFVTPLLAEN